MIKTIIYENYNLLGNSRLAYMSTADAQHVTGCLILNTKPFILPMNSFGCIYSQIHKRSLLSVLFCVRRWISLGQNLRTRKSPNPFFIVIPGVVEINNVTQSLLDHCSSSTSCCLVAIYIKGSFVIRVDCINTADSCSAQFLAANKK